MIYIKINLPWLHNVEDKKKSWSIVSNNSSESLLIIQAFTEI